MKQVRGRARCALDIGAALIAMAAGSGVRADVRPINLDECSASCLLPMADDSTADEDDAPASITLSRFGGDADDPNSALIFDRKAVPAALADGLPSALASASAEAPGPRGVSPYDFFADVIDVPRSADATFFPFSPAPTNRLSDFLWASSDFFGRPSGDIASRRGLALSVDADALFGAMTMRTRVAPTRSPSPPSGPPPSGPPPSDASEPFGQVGDEAGRSTEFSSDGAESNK